MAFVLYNYLSATGTNEFKEWTEGLQSKERGKLNEKIDKLEQHGDALYPHMLAGTSVAGIQKLRVQGPVKLRPLLCKGPVSVATEYTLLMGAKEVGNKWTPKKAPEQADAKKSDVATSPATRRKLHERVSDDKGE